MRYLSILFICLLISCEKKVSLFNQVSYLNSEIDFRNDLTENQNFNLVEYLYYYNGGGVSTGDINNDGELNILDVVRLVQFALQQQIPSDIEFYQGDLNADDNLNILDIVELINMILFN